MKKVGAILITLLILTFVSVWFLLLNLENFTNINLFGLKLENVSSGALALVSFIGGGIIIWIISFIAHSVEISQIKSELEKCKKELAKKEVTQPQEKETDKKE